MYSDILNGLTVVGYGISTFAELAPQYWSSQRIISSEALPSVKLIAIMSNFVFSGHFGKVTVDEVVLMYSVGFTGSSDGSSEGLSDGLSEGSSVGSSVGVSSGFWDGLPELFP